jgi:hypothetical protein
VCCAALQWAGTSGKVPVFYKAHPTKENVMTASKDFGTRPLTAAELDQVSGGVDIGGAIVTVLNALINVLFPPVTLEVGPVTVTPSPKK